MFRPNANTRNICYRVHWQRTGPLVFLVLIKLVQAEHEGPLNQVVPGTLGEQEGRNRARFTSIRYNRRELV